jgi:hypothetical protein
MEFLEEYRCPINYYPGKANVVADAISCKVRMVHLRAQEIPPIQEVLVQGAEMREEGINVSNLNIVLDFR